MRCIKWLAYSLVLCSVALSSGGDAGAAVSGPKTGVVCLDNTDLAASDLLPAKQVLATSIKALPAPGSPGGGRRLFFPPPGARGGGGGGGGGGVWGPPGEGPHGGVFGGRDPGA